MKHRLPTAEAIDLGVLLAGWYADSAMEVP